MQASLSTRSTRSFTSGLVLGSLHKDIGLIVTLGLDLLIKCASYAESREASLAGGGMAQTHRRVLRIDMPQFFLARRATKRAFSSYNTCPYTMMADIDSLANPPGHALDGL